MGQMSFSIGISVSEVGVIQEKPPELGKLCLAQSVWLGTCHWSEKENISNMC